MTPRKLRVAAARKKECIGIMSYGAECLLSQVKRYHAKCNRSMPLNAPDLLFAAELKKLDLVIAVDDAAGIILELTTEGYQF